MPTAEYYLNVSIMLEVLLRMTQQIEDIKIGFNELYIRYYKGCVYRD